MSTNHPQRTEDGKVKPAWVEGSWARPAQRNFWIKRTALAAWLAEYFVVRGRDLFALSFVFGTAGFVAGLLGCLL